MKLALTRRTDLAAKALVTLESSGSRIKSADLATALETTPGIVPQVLGPLVLSGWVLSIPGPTGGYELATPIHRISVLDVVEAVEGPVDDGRCVVAGRHCAGREPCALHEAWYRARSRMLSELAETPVSSLPPIPAAADSHRSIHSASKGVAES
jgi:Rrf2 family protein